MGCWDIFCFICGNPSHSMIYDLEYFKEEISKSYSKYPNDQIKILHENKNILTDLKKLSRNIKWLNKCSILLENNKVIHGVKEVDCNITFCKNNLLLLCSSYKWPPRKPLLLPRRRLLPQRRPQRPRSPRPPRPRRRCKSPRSKNIGPDPRP